MEKKGPGKIARDALKNLFKDPATTSYAGKGTIKVERGYSAGFSTTLQNV